MATGKDYVNEIKEKFVEMILGQYSCWNTTNKVATISKMLYHLNKCNLFETAEKDFQTSKKAYMGEFMSIITDINKISPIDEVSDTILLILIKAIGESGIKYNLKNYRMLKDNNSLTNDDLFTQSMISAFDTDFRGDIVDIIKIEDKYIIIKTYVDVDDEYQFYIKKSDDNSIKSGMYLSVEHALCGLICYTHLGAMIALVEDEKRVESESR